MAGYFLLAVLAAFGLLSLMWALFGWLLPACREGWVLCPGETGKLSFVNVYLWLRGMGLVKCPLILVDMGLEEAEKDRLTDEGIEICSLAELPARLGIGAEAN